MYIFCVSVQKQKRAVVGRPRVPAIASTVVASRQKMVRLSRANAIRAIRVIFAPTVSLPPLLMFCFYPILRNRPNEKSLPPLLHTRANSSTNHCVSAHVFVSSLTLIDVNDCADSPCRNGGTCIDGIDSFHCVCPKGYDGLTCDHSKNPFSFLPSSQLLFFFSLCIVRKKKKKKKMQILEWMNFVLFLFSDVDDCAANPCRHNGTCVDLVADFVCRCVDGWKGRTCSNRNQHCQHGENPCLNGATCVDDSNPEAGFTCRCSSGWRGSICHLGKYRHMSISLFFRLG